MSGPVTVRHPGNVAVAVAVWLLCLLAIVDGVIRGSGGYVLHAVLVGAAASLAAWMIFLRPRLIVDADGLRLINVLRSYDIPFGALVSWHVGGVLTAEIRTAGDRVRKLTSWGAPGIKRQRPSALSLMGRSRRDNVQASGQSGLGGAVASRSAIDSRSVTELAIEYREKEWRRDHPKMYETIARVRWNWPQLLALGALLVANVAVG